MTCRLQWSLPADDAETQLRIRPLREQWEARGPGLLGRLRTILPWLEFPHEVTVWLINPKVGGAGRILSPSEIEFEAVLANPWPMLPEVVRMAWLIACSSISDDHRAAIGIIPAVVAAAEYVELARLDGTTIECALQHWHLEANPAKDVSSAALMNWWEGNRSKVTDAAGWREALDRF